MDNENVVYIHNEFSVNSKDNDIYRKMNVAGNDHF